MEFGAPWYTHDKTSTVWSPTTFGDVLIADCSSKVLTVASQRLNARLIATAPTMIELLRTVYHQAEPAEQERISEVLRYIYDSPANTSGT